MQQCHLLPKSLPLLLVILVSHHRSDDPSGRGRKNPTCCRIGPAGLVCVHIPAPRVCPCGQANGRGRGYRRDEQCSPTWAIPEDESYQNECDDDLRPRRYSTGDRQRHVRHRCDAE